MSPFFLSVTLFLCMSSIYYIGCLIYIPDVLFVFQMSDIHVWAPLNPGHSLMYKYALVMYMAQSSTEGALESNLREKSTRIATIVAMAPIEISSIHLCNCIQYTRLMY